MAFPVQRNLERLQDRQTAAADCWFTADGKTMPRFCKLIGIEEEIITIRDICILKEEQKFYAGINAKKHWCEAEHNGVMMRFYLVFYPEYCIKKPTIINGWLIIK